MSYPVIDLELAFSPLTRPILLKDLRNALIHHGYFLVTNYHDYLDSKIVSQINKLNHKFFNLPNLVKEQINIVNSRHFRGYYHNQSSTEKSTSLQDSTPISKKSLLSDSKPLSRDGNLKKENVETDYDEEILIGVDALGVVLPQQFEEPKSHQGLYTRLRGPNQMPSSTALPGFKQSIKRFLSSMNQFSTDLLNELIWEAIHCDGKAPSRNLFDNLFDANENEQCHKIKLTRRVPVVQNDKNGTVLVSPVYNHKEGSALTVFSFSSEQDTADISIEVTNSIGQKQTINSIPSSSLLVSISPYLEAITKGVCASSTINIPTPSTNVNITTYSHCISIDFMYRNFRIPSSFRLIIEKATNERKLLGDRSQKPIDIQSLTEELFDNFGMSVFNHIASSFPKVSCKWYPRYSFDHLNLDSKGNNIDQSTSISAEIDRQNLKLKEKLKFLYNLFVSIDSCILLHSISSPVPITLECLRERVAHQAPSLQFDLKYIRQINTIWPDAYHLSVSPIDNSTLIIQFPSSITSSNPTSLKSPPQTPVKRKHVFRTQCDAWFKAYIEKQSSNAEDCNIPLAPIGNSDVPSTPKRRRPDSEFGTPAQYLDTLLKTPSSRKRLRHDDFGSPAPCIDSILQTPSPRKRHRLNEMTGNQENHDPLTPPSSASKSSMSLMDRIKAKEESRRKELDQFVRLSSSCKSPLFSPSKVLPSLSLPTRKSPIKNGRLALAGNKSPTKRQREEALVNSHHYTSYIWARLPAIASILAGLRPPSHSSSSCTYPFADVIKKIKDSLRTELSSAEVTDALRMLAYHVPEFIAIASVGIDSVVRIYSKLSYTSVENILYRIEQQQAIQDDAVVPIQKPIQV